MNKIKLVVVVLLLRFQQPKRSFLAKLEPVTMPAVSGKQEIVMRF